MKPPPDPLALEELLTAMLPSKKRFFNTKKVHVLFSRSSFSVVFFPISLSFLFSPPFPFIPFYSIFWLFFSLSLSFPFFIVVVFFLFLFYFFLFLQFSPSMQFKNYMFSDESLELAAQLFPSLEKLDLDGGRLTKKGITVIPKFTKLRFLSLYCLNV
jgi:hypothetical protein